MDPTPRINLAPECQVPLWEGSPAVLCARDFGRAISTSPGPQEWVDELQASPCPWISHGKEGLGWVHNTACHLLGSKDLTLPAGGTSGEEG